MKVIPDIVVCNTKEVISVIELKYLPRAKPKHKKDMDNLSLIAENRKVISIANDRFRGSEKDANQYTLSNHILFVWAGVHAKEKNAESSLYSVDYPARNECFMELHAETKLGANPDVFHKS